MSSIPTFVSAVLFFVFFASSFTEKSFSIWEKELSLNTALKFTMHYYNSKNVHIFTLQLKLSYSAKYESVTCPSADAWKYFEVNFWCKKVRH